MKPFHVQLVAANQQGLGIRFSDACSQLATIARLHLELDGSFVWVGNSWQIDGMLYDRQECLQYVDLKGCCPKTVWRALVNTLSTLDALPQVISLPWGDLYDLQTFEDLVWSAGVQDADMAE